MTSHPPSKARRKNILNGTVWYPCYPGEFLNDIRALTFEERGAYAQVLNLIHFYNGKISDDPQWIARQCNCSTRTWKRIRAVLLHKGPLVLRDGYLTSPRADRTLTWMAERQEAKTEAARANGRKSVDRRKSRFPAKSDDFQAPRSTPVEYFETPGATEETAIFRAEKSTFRTAQNEQNQRHFSTRHSETQRVVVRTPIQESGLHPESLSPIRSTSRARQRIDGKEKAQRIPRDWAPDESDRVYAHEHNVNPDRAGEEFRLYWSANGGSSARKLDWHLAFRHRVLELEEKGRFPLNAPADGRGRLPLMTPAAVAQKDRTDFLNQRMRSFNMPPALGPGSQLAMDTAFPPTGAEDQTIIGTGCGTLPAASAVGVGSQVIMGVGIGSLPALSAIGIGTIEGKLVN